MKQEQWDVVLAAAEMRELDAVPASVIVDSPWIPGYVGISTLDYLTDVSMWWDAQQKIRADFPDVIFMPDYWVEFGMGAEPSGFGCKMNFYENQPLTIEHLISSCDDLESLDDMPQPNPRRDGVMPIVLNYYKRVAKMARDIGDPIRMVCARGPLNAATHMIGVTEFLTGLKLYPESTRKLLQKTTLSAKNWLDAQIEAVGGAEGILMLDDIIGFLSPEDYMEFAHPYFKEIYGAFADLPVRMLHNDTDNPVSYPHLADLGVNLFNFTHERKLSEVRALCGDSVCLVGNVSPLHVLCYGTPEDVARDAMARLDDYGDKRGIILTPGGGASPGMPAANLNAMIAAAREWSAGYGKSGIAAR